MTSFWFCGIAMLFVLNIGGALKAQSPSEQINAPSPFAHEALIVPEPADMSGREVGAVQLSKLPSTQTPQLRANPQYRTSGKEFYVVFLSSVSSDQNSTPVRRVYIAARSHVRGKISHVGGSWSQSFEAMPRTLTPVNLPLWASLGRFETEAAYRRVFKIETEDVVAVYAVSPNYLSSDAFLVLPKETLGKEYLVASARNALWYNQGTLGPMQNGEPFPRSEFAVAAIEDGTEVVVRLTAQSSTRRYDKGYYYKFNLDRGEVIQFMARDTGRLAMVNYFDNVSKSWIPKMSWIGKETDGTDCDLTGSEVLSTKPVAVFSGHERASIPDDKEFAYEDHPDVSRDHLIEQMPPVEVWGRKFVAISSSQNEARNRPTGGDIVRVIARYDGTQVVVNGVLRATLNQGEFSQFMSGDFAYIETSQPALVVKYTQTADPKLIPGIGDPDMTVVPPIENMSTFFSLPTVTLGNYFTEHYINLIIDTGAYQTTLLNGLQPDMTAFKALPNLPYMYARFRTQFEGEQRVESSLPCYAETYGYGDVDSYSFAGGGDFNYIKGLSANDLNFGFVKLGDSRDSVTTMISTIKPSPLADTITIFRYTWDSGDTTVFGLLDTIRTPLVLAPGETLPVSFSFKPNMQGAFRAKLRVWSSNQSPVYINVLGTSGVVYLEVNPNIIDFGRVRVNTPVAAIFKYTVAGDNKDGIVKIFYDHVHDSIASQFKALPPVLNKAQLLYGEGDSVQITFLPLSPGYYRDTVNMDNDGEKIDTQFVFIYGRGVAADPVTVDTGFGKIRYETPSQWYRMPIINRGSDFATIESITKVSGDSADFDLRLIPIGVRLDTAGVSDSVQYYEARFEPQYKSNTLVRNDLRSCRVRIVTTDKQTIYADLTGEAVEPWFDASPINIDFGTVRNPLLTDPGIIRKKFALRNIGSMEGIMNALTIPPHSPTDTPYYFSVETRPQTTFNVNIQDSIEVTFFINNVGVFRDSVVVENDSRSKPLIYLTGSVEAEYDLNDSIYLDTISDCRAFDTIIHIVNPYRIPIKIRDTLFSGNPGGFTFYPNVIVSDTSITIAPGSYFDFTLRYEFPIDSVNGLQELLFIITKPVVIGGVLSDDEDTVHVTLFRKMQLLDLVTTKLPYNPNAKDAPFRLPIHIKGNRFGKAELDNITIYLRFSNKLVLPVGIDRTGSLTESTPTNGVPPQPQWSWDEATSTMTVPIKGALTSTDPTNNTLLFTLLGTTYLTVDTMVEITPEISYEQKPCAYRISRDSTTIVYADECGDETIRNLILRNPRFSLGNPYPDPSSASDGKSIFIPYVSPQSCSMQWKLYDELGTVHHTAPEQHIDKGIGTLLIDENHVRSSGLYFIEVTVRDPHSQLVGRYVTKFAVTD